MDLYQLQKFFSEMYPGKQITYEFDPSCYRTNEIIFTDGKPNCIHHIECNKVKAIVEGMEPRYVPIISHRFTVSWADMKNFITKCNDVFIHSVDIEELINLKKESPENYILKMQSLISVSGLTQENIEAKF